MELEINAAPEMIWETLADQSLALFQQRWIYGAAAEAHGRDVLRIVVKQNSQPIALAQVLSRRIMGLTVSSCQGGPLWLADIGQEARRDICNQIAEAIPGRGVFLTTPLHTGDAGAMTRVMTPATLALLPISGDPEAMKSAMHGKWRNRLKSALGHGLRIKEERGTPARTMDVMLREAKQRKRLKYRGLPLNFIRTLAALDPKQLRLLTAYQDRTKLAEMFHITHGNTASYLVGWSAELGRDFAAHNLLMWKSMTMLGGRGFRQLDLGTVDTGRAAGLARFKLGAGAQAVPLGGTWAKVQLKRG